MADLLRIKRDTAATWTSNNPTLAAGELGFETDTKLLKVGDGSTAWTSLDYLNDDLTTGSIGSQIQAYDADLTTIGGLTATSGNFIVGDAGNAWSSVSTSSAKTTLGLGTLADSSTVSDTDLSEDLAITAGGTGASDAATARTNLGLAIGSDVLAYDATYIETSDIGSTVQAYDSNLTSFVSTFTLPTTDGTANQILITNGSGTLSFFSSGVASDTVADTASLPVDSTVSDGDIYFVIATNQLAVYDGTDSAWKLIDMTELSFGSTYGYLAGGQDASNTDLTDIELINFSTDTNGVDSGADLTVARSSVAGVSSDTSGYAMGGYTGGRSNIVDKFPFSTSSNATDVGDLVVGVSHVAGAFSSTYGYAMGGIAPATYNNPNGQDYANDIQKVAFSTDANASDGADLTDYKYGGSGHQSTTYGYYASGGSPLLPQNKVIEKFPFATDVNTTSTGGLTIVSATALASLSSSTNAYLTNATSINKFPFATDVNATDVGDLPNDARLGQAGTSANDYGYVCGGRDPSVPASAINYIQKFSFITDINGSDIGDLTTAKRAMTSNISN